MAWKITNDYCIEQTREILGADWPSRVGTRQGELAGETFRFRILDDDGEVYYGGVADAAAADDDEDEGGLYIALQWAEADAGATDLQVHIDDAIKHGLTSREYVDQLLSGQGDFSRQAQTNAKNNSKNNWVSIYG